MSEGITLVTGFPRLVAKLIVRELLMRQRVRKIVVACPDSVVLQWRDELDRRFGLTFAVFDRDFVLARRREVQGRLEVVARWVFVV